MIFKVNSESVKRISLFATEILNVMLDPHTSRKRFRGDTSGSIRNLRNTGQIGDSDTKCQRKIFGQIEALSHFLLLEN